MRLVLGPPYKGVAATIIGMTWARAAIFYGSDVGRDALQRQGCSPAVATTLPAVAISALVQVANQPIVRSTIMLQVRAQAPLAAHWERAEPRVRAG